MKVSLRWIFDHIDGDWQTIDTTQLVAQFNQKTAEIERWYTVSVDLNNFTLVQVKEKKADQLLTYSPEFKAHINLPVRSDGLIGHWYLARRQSYQWATASDLGGEKDAFLPSLFVAEQDQGGAWKNSFEQKDIILEVDNKSITHRPDLWGHRGFAREVAALVDKSVIPIDQLVARIPEYSYQTTSPAEHGSPFGVSLETPYCDRFASLYIDGITPTPSLIWMATRLSRVDSRCINAFVDTTNYVMFDLSQPMHAFDAQKIANKKITVRTAKNKAQLTLLDTQTISLTQDDIIIADGDEPISLAGIMGGASTAVTTHTQQLLIESAHFDAAVIRKSSVNHKLRTEGSARSEKSLDPNQNIQALQRFIFLMNCAQIPFACTSGIMSIGKSLEPMGIDISHQFIEDRLGTTVSVPFVIATLTKLDFTVEHSTNDAGAVWYFITVPPFRCVKDVTLPEDIVEEVGRFFGYDAIPAQLPQLPLTPKDMHAIEQLTFIKEQLAFNLQMHEVNNYPFYDEALLKQLAWEPSKTISIKNPVSEHAKRLVTSLIPHLLKSVQQNHADYDKLRFFESSRVWHQHDGMTEQKKVAGIFYDAKKSIDFYMVKELLDRLFVALRLPVNYASVTEVIDPWFTPYHSAYVKHGDTIIGTVGPVPSSFLSQLCEGHAVVFEFDLAFLTLYQAPTTQFKPLPKYPLVTRDISLLVPVMATVQELSDLIKGASKVIISVDLIDFFTKKEWIDQKALTFRYICRDDQKTMEKHEIDQIEQAVIAAVQQAGATVR